jgi:hypothetical protein
MRRTSTLLAYYDYPGRVSNTGYVTSAVGYSYREDTHKPASQAQTTIAITRPELRKMWPSTSPSWILLMNCHETCLRLLLTGTSLPMMLESSSNIFIGVRFSVYQILDPCRAL